MGRALPLGLGRRLAGVLLFGVSDISNFLWTYNIFTKIGGTRNSQSFNRHGIRRQRHMLSHVYTTSKFYETHSNFIQIESLKNNVQQTYVYVALNFVFFPFLLATCSGVSNGCNGTCVCSGKVIISGVAFLARRLTVELGYS